MRKLPETLAKIIREFEEEDGGFVGGGGVAGALLRFAPDDDALEAHVALAEARMPILTTDGQLRPEAELPSGAKSHPFLVDGKLPVHRLFI
jgi:hypothetical protein